VDLAGDPAVEAELVLAGDREAGAVFPAGDVVRLDRVESLAGAEVEAVLQRLRKEAKTTDVEPALVREAFVSTTDDRLGELLRVRPVGLPTADVEVADDLAPSRCSRCTLPFETSKPSTS
jgi:hypothetical protein